MKTPPIPPNCELFGIINGHLKFYVSGQWDHISTANGERRKMIALAAIGAWHLEHNKLLESVGGPPYSDGTIRREREILIAINQWREWMEQ